MPKPLTLDLSDEERRRLEEARDRHDKPYVRERATALLKIADGWSGREMALRGLLKQRKPDTVYDWFHRYQENGFNGLFISEGRGRKPAFSPEHDSAQQAKQALFSVVRRDPWPLVEQTRWSLEAIRKRCPWLRVTTDSGLWRLLDRLGITYKRGRHYTYSPDPDYQEKRNYIQGKLERTRQEPERYAFLYQDECGYYRKPSLAKGYEAKGAGRQPRARLGHAERTRHRVAAGLNALSGRVCYRQAEAFSADELASFYQQIRAAYPEVETIYLVQDNWPVHFHADLIGQLEAQKWPWPFNVPEHWPDLPEEPVARDPLPIQLLCLPTYASWLNPIEKLWRWLKQEVIHLHRLADAFDELKRRVASFLERFDEGSPALLRYTGLLPA